MGDVGDAGFGLPSFFEYSTGGENLGDLGNQFLGQNAYTVIGNVNTGSG